MLSSMQNVLVSHRRHHQQQQQQHRPLSSNAPLVIFSLGTIMDFDTIAEVAVRKMFKAFHEYPHCEFHVRIDKSKVPERLLEKTKAHVRVYDTRDPAAMIPQQELLANRDVRLLIIHCGQNSLTEAFYAGVPVICLPFFGDQHYNAAVLEYMRVGVWVQHVHFAREFVPAFHKLMAPGNEYWKMAKRVAAALLAQREQPKHIFLRAIRSAIDECEPIVDDHASPAVVYDPNFEVKDFEAILVESEQQNCAQ